MKTFRESVMRKGSMKNLTVYEEVRVLRKEVQRLCDENHKIKKENEKLKKDLKSLYKGDVRRENNVRDPIIANA